jgi:hypothetical protein
VLVGTETNTVTPTLTLRFDCKPCEMHVGGAMRKNVLKQLKAESMTLYRT